VRERFDLEVDLERSLDMKKLLVAVVIALMLSGCAGNMLVSDKPDGIAAKPDKSLLVIVRDTFFASDSIFYNYIDGKLIGDTQGKTWFMTEVSPGPHYVIAVGGIAKVALVNFKPGKVYSLRQGAFMGPWRGQPRDFWPMSYVETVEMIRPCEYLEFSPGKEASDMDPAVYKSIIEQYHDQVRSNPDSYLALQEYIGF